MLNLATLLERSARVFPDKAAIVFSDTQLTYQQFNETVNQLANGLLALGIKPGDHIALTCPNVPYFPLAYFAILKVGGVVVPINVLLKTDEIAYHLKDSQAKAYLCFQGSPEIPMGKMGFDAFQKTNTCDHFVEITPKFDDPATNQGIPTLGEIMSKQSPSAFACRKNESDTAVILYTSGTTGQPKGAELTHANITMNAMISQSLMQLTSNDSQLLVLPLFHSFGQVVQMCNSVLVGATMVLLPRFDPKAVFEALEQHKITVFAGVPTMYIGLLNYPESETFDLKSIQSHLRLGVSGGASMPVAVLEKFESKFDVPILEGYGLSETSPVASFNYLDKPRKVGSVGQPAYGIDIQIMNSDGHLCEREQEGEVVVRGHNIMKGYFNRPEDTSKAIKNGWFHTGDIGKLDADGDLYIVDRLKDMIIRGGYNIYPREIEEIMMKHPDIAQVAIVGVPHDVHGEEVKAFVILQQGATLDVDTLKHWCKDKMADYKYPRDIEYVEQLPMTATGKILKRELR